MKVSALSAVATLLVSLAEEPVAASTSRTRAETEFQVARLAAEVMQRRSNPTGDYAPSFGTCPPVTNDSISGGSNQGYVRNTQSYVVSSNETDYVNRHRASVQNAWTTWLSSSQPGPGLDGSGGIPGGVANYTSNVDNLPRVGIALSGGGYRAMLHGAAYVMGLDSRNTTAQARGTAGFLQMADYISGLSGGSWAVGSLALNDWPTTQDLVENVWDLNENLIIPKDNTVSYYANIVTQVAGKRHEGFTTGIVDYWGRALSYHLVNSTYPNEGEATTFADIRNTSNFISATFPFPLVIADEREPGELLIYRNTTLFEFNPFEFGSWDPSVAGFVPIDILGTTLNNGESPNSGSGNCTRGFDNFGYVVGTSSTLFNGLYDMLITNDGDSVIKDALQSILGAVSDQDNDVSVLPNPFFGYRNGDVNASISTTNNITLVDGGEDNQNVPINTLLYPGRDLDFILAVDSSADSTDWPNGTAIRETFLRYQDGPKYDTIPFPNIPSANTFLNRGLNTRPTFFGCDSTVNITNANTAAHGVKAPIIAYVANYPWSALSNTSTFQLQYTAEQAQEVVDNAVNVATMGGITNGSIYWPTCLACAALQRSFERTNTVRPSLCTECFDAYCWDGVTNDTTPSLAYSPSIGPPAWVTSQGSIQAFPQYTGGNGSNADQSDNGTPVSASDGALNDLLPNPLIIAALAIIATATSCLVTLL